MSIAGQRVFPSYTHHCPKKNTLTFACPLYDPYLSMLRKNVIKCERRKLMIENNLNELP